MGGVDASRNPDCETLNEQLCTELASDYPIRAISCQLQVYQITGAVSHTSPAFTPAYTLSAPSSL
jgi:hypothetical protein